MNQNEISNLIIKHIGGAENVVDMYHCMTRLRFKLNDPQKFNTEELKRIPGVINTVSAGNEYQLIIGAEVDKFYNDLQKHGLGKAAANSVAGVQGIAPDTQFQKRVFNPACRRRKSA